MAHNERAGRGQPRQLSGVKRTSQFDRCALIIREYFPPKEAGTRIGIILMASLFGMAMGGWMSGYIFDLTGSYRAAFFNGLGWNAVNGAIVLWILFRRGFAVSRHIDLEDAQTIIAAIKDTPRRSR